MVMRSLQLAAEESPPLVGSTKPFINEDFLLQSPAARALFHGYAKALPIVDFHCHLPAEALADNTPFRNMTHLWLEGDHYKWRALRTDGVAEQLITGSASDQEKFAAFAACVPRLVGNPIYHWTHMELADPFGITDRLLSPATADGIWEACNARLATREFTPRGLVTHFRAEVICTTDDPADSLAHHAAIARDDSFPVRVLPTFRPDRALAIEDPTTWNNYLEKLGAAADRDINSWDELVTVLASRAAFFASHGCRLADCGIPEPYADGYTLSDVRAAFIHARFGRVPEAMACRRFRAALIHELNLVYHGLDWTSQFHIGALRNCNTRFRTTLGADSGHDTIGDLPMAQGLARMLDRLDVVESLPRTILYNLNPADNELFAAMTGCFQQGPTPARVQYGPAWWFLDQKNGIERQLIALANMGMLSRFVGMVTDSRSFLSYSRHDYFRRILCNMLGEDMEKGLIPNDLHHIGGIVRAICHDNALSYLGIDTAPRPRPEVCRA